MKFVTIVAAFAASLAFTTATDATEFVVNGDFTSLTNGVGELKDPYTAATGWTTTGYNYVLHDATVGDANNGEYGYLGIWDGNNGGLNAWDGLTLSGVGNYAVLDGDFNTAPLEQTITNLTVGALYRLSFNYAYSQQTGFTGDTVQHITASLGNDSYTTPEVTLPSQGFDGWHSFSGAFLASSTSEVLSFLAYGDVPVPPFSLVSDVSLTEAVPEPSTWAMMILGIGALGVVARRGRALATA